MTIEDSMKNDGGPAFPSCNEANVNDTLGMSLRDWFAGQAGSRPDVMFASIFSHTWAAWLSYQIADAMLEARK